MRGGHPATCYDAPMSDDSHQDHQALSDAFRELSKMLSAIGEEFFPAPTEAEVYHYTRIDNVLKILSNSEGRLTRPDHSRRCLWFADAFTMNDTAEVAHGEALFERAIRTGLGGRGAHFDGVARTMQWMRGNYFVLSMSKVRDSLSMWRAYGGDGEGVSLAISLKALRGFEAPRVWPGNYVASCLYERQEELERKLASLVANATIDISDDRILKKFLENLAMQLGALIPFIKNPAYSEEQELRAVCATHDEKNVFCMGRPPRKYLEIEFEHEVGAQLFRGATIGPSPHQLFHKRAVEHLIAKTRDSQTIILPVHLSSIPYRGKLGA